ncbi:MAG: C-type lectin domain-containing protein, partial [Ruminococcus sp.]|nr:C-type lectin domain-containing protein [Ruminococcus sp.]
SYAEAIAYYDAYFENLIGYQTTVQKISMEDYVSMSDEEKLAVLTESYNAWSYTEDNSIERPLADVIDELRGKVETTESAIPNTAVQWNGSSYQLFDNVVDTYEEAAAYCESLGGHLAIIGSKEENDYLYDYVTSLGYENAYFGYTDKDNEGEWLCIDGSNADYTNWHSDEPNGKNIENYAEFYYKFTDGTWNDGDFGDGETVNDCKAFICEWD